MFSHVSSSQLYEEIASSGYEFRQFSVELALPASQLIRDRAIEYLLLNDPHAPPSTQFSFFPLKDSARSAFVSELLQRFPSTNFVKIPDEVHVVSSSFFLTPKSDFSIILRTTHPLSDSECELIAPESHRNLISTKVLPSPAFPLHSRTCFLSASTIN